MGKKTKGRQQNIFKNSVPDFSIPKTKTSTIFYPTFDANYPIWTFRNVDREGKFAFNPLRKDFKSDEFVEKMLSYSNMKWQEILQQTHDDGKTKHHFLNDIDRLSKDARERIKAKKFEDKTDKIFSFAFNNITRVIGLRDGAEFQVIWYDANHEFALSEKKHT